MSNLLMLAICLAAGLVLRRSGRAPHDAHLAIKAVIIHVSLPALTLRYLHGFDFSATQFAVRRNWNSTRLVDRCSAASTDRVGRSVTTFHRG